jgi:hypothetical protein
MVNARLFRILTTYRCCTREFAAAARQADAATRLAARDELAKRNKDNRKRREIIALDAVCFRDGRR